MAVTTTDAQSNGFGLGGLDNETLQRSLQQLLDLRDAVLSDTHPRLKLSQAARERLLQLSSASAPRIESLAHSLTKEKNRNALLSHGRHDLVQPAHSGLSLDQVPPSSLPQKMQFSDIDQGPLTESDDHVRAELYRKRQRIEREIYDTWQRQPAPNARHRDAGSEPASLDALEQILQKAQELVKPISGVHPVIPIRAASVSSFDENDYYSSKASSWSSDDYAPLHEPLDPANHTSKVNSQTASSTQALPGLASSTSHFRPVSSPYHHPENTVRPTLEPVKSQQGPPPSYAQGYGDSDELDEGEVEDSDYSPPAAEAFTTDGDADGDAMDLGDQDESEYDPQPELPTAVIGPSPIAPIITNRLTSIAAPQPSRVSPLAVAKMPGMDAAQANIQSQGGWQNQYHGANQYYPPESSRAAQMHTVPTPPQPLMREYSTSGQTSPNVPLSKRQQKALRKTERDNIHNPKRAAQNRGEMLAEKRLKRKEKKAKQREEQHQQRGQQRALQLAQKHEQARMQEQEHEQERERKRLQKQQRRDEKEQRKAQQSQQPGPSRLTVYAASPPIAVKEEPISPPPFVTAAERPTYGSGHMFHPDVELVSPRHFASSQVHYDHTVNARASPHDIGRPSSVHQHPQAAFSTRPLRDDQDLRRVASLHAAQRPHSPDYRREAPVFSSAQSYQASPSHRAEPHAYADQRPSTAVPQPPPGRRIVTDQYGNKYYATEATPAAPRATMAPPSLPDRHIAYDPYRASVAPASMRHPEVLHDRTPIRATTAHATQAPYQTYPDLRQSEHLATPVQRPLPPFEPDGFRRVEHLTYPSTTRPAQNYAAMAPPHPPARVASRAETGGFGYREPASSRAYSVRPEAAYGGNSSTERPFYVHHMPPPPPSNERQYARYPDEYAVAGPQNSRAYSIQPEIPPSVRYVSRQPSVALYTDTHHRDAAAAHARAASVMPTTEYAPRTADPYAYPRSIQQASPYGARYIG